MSDTRHAVDATLLPTSEPPATITPAARPRPPAPAGAPLPARVQEVVYEDDHVLMEWSVRTPATDTIAVTFDPILLASSEPAYAADFLHRSGIDTLCVRKKSEHFYQPLTRERFEEAARPVLNNYRRRLAYGSSLGAYAVLYFCMHGFETVISSSPRVSAHPRFGRPHWQERVPFRHEFFDAQRPATSGAVVFFDPYDTLDRRFIDEGLRTGWPHAQFVAVPYAGHPANQFLSEIGYISSFVQAVVASRPAPALERRARKDRSFTYRHILAMACLRHGKTHWAERLCVAALTMKPDLVGVKLTLGQALLALGRLDEAEQALREFLQRYPQDGDAELGLRTIQHARARRVRQHWLPALLAQWQRRKAMLRAALRAWRARAAMAWPWLPGRLHLAVSREDVEWCYRQLLGRPPESEEALLSHRRCRRFELLVRAFMGSPEYQSQVAGGPVASTFELRVRTACLVRRLLPLGGQMGHLSDQGAAGFFGATACLRLDEQGRRNQTPQSPSRASLELALWSRPLQPGEPAMATLRTLGQLLRRGGHALVAIQDQDASRADWLVRIAATGFECMQVDLVDRSAGEAIVWARKR